LSDSTVQSFDPFTVAHLTTGILSIEKRVDFDPFTVAHLTTGIVSIERDELILHYMY